MPLRDDEKQEVREIVEEMLGIKKPAAPKAETEEKKKEAPKKTAADK